MYTSLHIWAVSLVFQFLFGSSFGYTTNLTQTHQFTFDQHNIIYDLMMANNTFKVTGLYAICIGNVIQYYNISYIYAFIPIY